MALEDLTATWRRVCEDNADSVLEVLQAAGVLTLFDDPSGWPAMALRQFDEMLRMPYFVGACAAVCGVCVLLMAVLRVLRRNVEDDTREFEAEAAKCRRQLQENQAAHNVAMARGVLQLETLDADLANIDAQLRELRSRCARRAALARHIRAVNATFESDYTDVLCAIESVMREAEMQDLLPLRETNADDAGADGAAAYPPVDSDGNTSSCGSSAESAPHLLNDTLTPERATAAEQQMGTPAQYEQGSPQSVLTELTPGVIGASPDPRANYADVPIERWEPRSGDELLQTVAAAIGKLEAAQRDRDGAAVELLAAQREYELVEERDAELNEAHAARLGELRERVLQQRDRLVAERTPERRVRHDVQVRLQRARELGVAGQGPVDLRPRITMRDVRALPFDPRDEAAVAEREAFLEELEAAASELTRLIADGYGEVDELMALAAHQRVTIADLEDEALLRGRAFGACADDGEEVSDSDNDHDVELAIRSRFDAERLEGVDGAVDAADVAARSVERTRRVEDETRWLRGEDTGLFAQSVGSPTAVSEAARALEEAIALRTATEHEMAEMRALDAEEVRDNVRACHAIAAQRSPIVAGSEVAHSDDEAELLPDAEADAEDGAEHGADVATADVEAEPPLASVDAQEPAPPLSPQQSADLLAVFTPSTKAPLAAVAAAAGSVSAARDAESLIYDATPVFSPPRRAALSVLSLKDANTPCDKTGGRRAPAPSPATALRFASPVANVSDDAAGPRAASRAPMLRDFAVDDDDEVLA